jgi:hypothetical protein
MLVGLLKRFSEKGGRPGGGSGHYHVVRESEIKIKSRIKIRRKK